MQTPALEQLMGAYFHQDFYVSYGGVWETVDQFIRDSPANAEQLPGEVDRVLQRCRGDDELRSCLNRLGCEYRPAPEDGGYRGWLTEVARRVREATENGKA